MTENKGFEWHGWEIAAEVAKVLLILTIIIFAVSIVWGQGYRAGQECWMAQCMELCRSGVVK